METETGNRKRTSNILDPRYLGCCRTITNGGPKRLALNHNLFYYYGYTGKLNASVVPSSI